MKIAYKCLKVPRTQGEVLLLSLWLLFGCSSHCVGLVAVLFVVVQLLSFAWLFATPWTAACQATLSFTISWSLLKPMSIKSVMPSNHLTLCHPFLLLPSIFPGFRVLPVSWLFTSGGQSTGTSASASVLPLNIQGWFPLGLTGLIFLQSKELSRVLKASILQCSAIFMVQLSHPYMTTGKTIAFITWTFGGRVISLLLICCLGLS